MEKNINLSEYELPSDIDIENLTFGIVVSDWNKEITLALKKGCLDTLRKVGIDAQNIHELHVPGSFELPLGARLLDDKHQCDALICLGCVIQGETSHNEYINRAVASGLTQLGLMRAKPVIFGVLTPNTMDQARARAGGEHGNKGIEAAITAIRMATARRDLQEPAKKIGFG